MAAFGVLGLPLLVTHVLPMAVVYCWVVVPVAAAVAMIVIAIYAAGYTATWLVAGAE